MSAAHKKSLFLESLRLLDNQTFINPLGFLKKPVKMSRNAKVNIIHELGN